MIFVHRLCSDRTLTCHTDGWIQFPVGAPVQRSNRVKRTALIGSPKLNNAGLVNTLGVGLAIPWVADLVTVSGQSKTVFVICPDVGKEE